MQLGATVLPRTQHRRAAWSALAVAGVSGVAAGVFAILAARAYGDFQNTNLERPSIDARERYQRYGFAAIGAAVVGTLSGAVSYWLWNHHGSDSANRR